MKRLSFLFFILINFAHTFSQAPQGINYQAVIRDGTSLLINQNVNIQFSLLQNEVLIYQEIHTAQTNTQGLINLILGEGTDLVGTFSTLDWSLPNWSLKVEIDTGSGFVEMGTQALQSVPFSLYADKASIADQMLISDLLDVSNIAPSVGEVLKWNGSSWEPTVDNVASGGGAVNTTARIIGDGTIGNPLDIADQGANTGEVLKWDGNNWVPQIDETDDADADPGNEIQSLSLAGNNLMLSNGGGSVLLPTGTTYSAGAGIGITGNVINNLGDTNPNNDITDTSNAGGDVSGMFSSLQVDKIKGFSRFRSLSSLRRSIKMGRNQMGAWSR